MPVKWFVFYKPQIGKTQNRSAIGVVPTVSASQMWYAISLACGYAFIARGPAVP